jgi:outer membrane receptor for ferrienterochelin and colicin
MEDRIKMYLWDDKQERKIHDDFQQDEQQARTNQKKVNKVDLNMKLNWNKQPKQHQHVSMSMWNKQVGVEQNMSTRSTTLHGPCRSMEETTLHGGENMLAWMLTWSQTNQIFLAHYEKSLLEKPNRTNE